MRAAEITLILSSKRIINFNSSKVTSTNLPMWETSLNLSSIMCTGRSYKETQTSLLRASLQTSKRYITDLNSNHSAKGFRFIWIETSGRTS